MCGRCRRPRLVVVVLVVMLDIVVEAAVAAAAAGGVAAAAALLEAVVLVTATATIARTRMWRRAIVEGVGAGGTAVGGKGRRTGCVQCYRRKK